MPSLSTATVTVTATPVGGVALATSSGRVYHQHRLRIAEGLYGLVGRGEHNFRRGLGPDPDTEGQQCRGHKHLYPEPGWDIHRQDRERLQDEQESAFDGCGESVIRPQPRPSQIHQTK